MHQLVDEPTRDQNTLDLVLTTNVDLIDNVVAGEPFIRVFLQAPESFVFLVTWD